MDSSENNEMSFIGHLTELRKRLIWSIIPITIIAIPLFIYHELIVDKLLLILTKKEFPTYQLFCNLSGENSSFCNDIPMVLIEEKISQGFSLSMYLAIVGGLILSIPFFIYQMWLFIKPALKENELKITRGIGFYVFLLLIIGILFGYYVVAPLCVNFFGNFFLSDDITKLPSIGGFYRLIVSTVLACALFFQLPIVIYFLSKIGLIGPEFLKKYRKHAIVIILILSAIITPPDFISQIIVSIPVLILYEIGIGISRRVVNKQKQNA